MLELICHGDAACVPELRLGALFCSAMLAIVFIQSGLDKVFDWSGNVAWLTDHFSETFFAGQLPLLVGVLTAFELASGVGVAVGAAILLATGAKTVALYALLACGTTLLQLFFGQRLAKDYPGAAILVPYMLVVVAGLALLAGA